TGARTAERIQKIVAQTGCEHRFFGLTGDSASSNLKAARLISTSTSSSSAMPKWSHLEQFFYCSGHVVNVTEAGRRVIPEGRGRRADRRARKEPTSSGWRRVRRRDRHGRRGTEPRSETGQRLENYTSC